MFLILMAVALVAAAVVFGRQAGARTGFFLAALAAALLLLVLGRGVDTGGEGDEAEGADGAEPVAFFLAPLEATSVSSPVSVRMGSESLADGHFHITVDQPCVGKGRTVPSDVNHHHFAVSQTETTLDLTPGIHTLCLQLGDSSHRARGQGDMITVEVRAAA